MKVAAIVPAYNERDRISTVLVAIKDAQIVDEIVVVCDGSTDGTYELVSNDPELNVVKLDPNRGKGGAMRAGAEHTDADVILFLDADLIGMDGDKVDAILKPVAEGDADMSIGIFKDGRGATDLAQFLTPYISGQRAMRRDVFLEIPNLDGVRSGVETAITKYFRAHRMKVSRVALSGCTHCMKEEKLGIARGFAARVRMYLDIGKILLDGHEFRK
ncbi:MAG: glycosyltransferase family 2 protein [Armatimonadota bacterium]|nr:glycosyltransferase family 2 protein [bacterium]